MRRSLASLAVMLATGGWVCDSGDSCPPSELTCPSDVADPVCCPQGRPYRCNGGCSATPQCADYDVCKYPDDPGSGLCTAGAYAAFIDDITCTAPSQPNGVYQIAASGTLVGCGVTAVSIEESPAATVVGADCGTWSSQTTTSGALECTPRMSQPGGSKWQLQSIVGGQPLTQVDITITVEIGGLPVIAQLTQPCPPLP